MYSIRQLSSFDLAEDDHEVSRDSMDLFVWEMQTGAAALPPSVLQTAGKAAELSTSNFMPTKKLSIGAYQGDVMHANPDTPMVELSGQTMPQLEQKHWSHIQNVKVRQSTWSVLQVAIVPLWLLAAVATGQGYDVDCDVQTVLLAGFVLAVSDLYIDRLTHVATAMEMLQEKSESGSVLMGVDVTVTFLVLAVQTVLVVLINFTTGWRAATWDRYYANSLTYPEEGMARSSAAGQTGIILFNLYFALSGLIKLARSYWHLGRKRNSRAWLHPKYYDELLLTSLIVVVLVYTFVVFIAYEWDVNWFVSIQAKHGTTREDLMTLQWAGDWARWDILSCSWCQTYTPRTAAAKPAMVVYR